MAITVKDLDTLCSTPTVTLSEQILALGDRSKNLFDKLTKKSLTIKDSAYDEQSKILTGKITDTALKIGNDRPTEIRFSIDKDNKYVTGFDFYATLPDNNWNIDNTFIKINLDIFRELGFSSGRLVLDVDRILVTNKLRKDPIACGALYFTFGNCNNELLVYRTDSTYTLSGAFTNLNLGKEIGKALQDLNKLPLVKDTSTVLALPDDFIKKITIDTLYLTQLSVAYNEKVQYFTVNLAIKPEPAWEIIKDLLKIDQISAEFTMTQTPVEKFFSVELSTTGKIWDKYALEAQIRLPELQFSGAITDTLDTVAIDKIAGDVSGLIDKGDLKPSLIRVAGEIPRGAYDLFVSLGSTNWKLGNNAEITGGLLHIAISGTSLPAKIRLAADLSIYDQQLDIAILKDGSTWKISGELTLQLREHKPYPARDMVFSGAITRGQPPTGMSYTASWYTPKGQGGVSLAQLAAALKISDSLFDELTEELTAATITYHSKDKTLALVINTDHTNIVYVNIPQ